MCIIICLCLYACMYEDIEFDNDLLNNISTSRVMLFKYTIDIVIDNCVNKVLIH